ncbi:heavy metal translocating P-type ATPase [Oscillatoria salina]|uniref:heavy metal translocating P-type ATPase n=1 Tax=Oscillatoria salina TaxID=331517 RepID=UPI0013B5D111|nr:heavy metal translocating P-type ATPase [Oscillatoria salina]MBZ8179465.1 heavy metal translocating P-type ATPase [Oscillatoria salina IIICB1]NET89094.1 heavy metal translocating P-type ATPase [Kamptonema sp. SIO1D9]
MVQLVEHPQTLTLVKGEKNGSKAPVARKNNQAANGSEITYTIVHEVLGRIRCRIERIFSDRQYVQRLQGLIGSDKNFSKVRFNYPARCVIVYYPDDAQPSKVRSRLIDLIQLAGIDNIPLRVTVKSREQSDRKICGLALQLPVLATTLSLLSGPFGLGIPQIIIRGTIAIAALPVVGRALEGIFRERRLNVDFLDLSALTITTIQGHLITSSSMLALIQLGESIRDLTARSSENQTQDLLSSLAQFVWVERNGGKEEIPLEEVQPGDIVIVYPGEQIPIDGTILRGTALIDEQKLTGESMPVVRNQGQAVYATTLVREGQIYVLTERTGAETRAGRTVQLIQDAPVHDTRIENYAAKIADRAVLPTLLLGSIVFAATGSPARAASVLTLDFATGIRVSVPTTVLAALTYAARHGILIRSGRALEKLAEIETIVFDKTGTLTLGRVSVVEIKTTSDRSAREVLQIAAAAEQRITHPVAEAIARQAQTEELEILPRGEWHYHVGLGIEAEINGEIVLVGSQRFLIQEGVSLEELGDRYPDFDSKSVSAIYVASDGKLQGVIQYDDPLRPESLEIVNALRTEIGAEIQMLTGDCASRAAAIAKKLEIKPSNTHAEAFPEQKAEIVQKLHEEGKTVAFVGDGLNDSAALAYADASISFRDGSDVARETADVVLMNNDLHGLVEAIAIARSAKQIIHQNTSIVAVPNLVGFILASTVGLNPMAATAINNGSSVVAGLNGLRPVLQPRKVQAEV